MDILSATLTYSSVITQHTWHISCFQMLPLHLWSTVHLASHSIPALIFLQHFPIVYLAKCLRLRSSNPKTSRKDPQSSAAHQNQPAIKGIRLRFEQWQDQKDWQAWSIFSSSCSILDLLSSIVSFVSQEKPLWSVATFVWVYRYNMYIIYNYTNINI